MSEVAPPTPVTPPVPVTTTPPAKPVPAGPTPASLKALEHTGLPPSLLRWKPKLPSRNWSIFLSIVGTVSYAYYYDRKECARLKKEYQDRVKYLAEEKIEGGSLGHGRKVTVYAAKWPEDDEWERGLQYFKRYVKPVLVAAAVDYDMVSCPQYGSLARHVSSHILTQRRLALSTQYNLPTPLEPPILDIMAGAPGQLSPEQREERRIAGGAILIGRHTLKEYMKGLEDGYMKGIKREEREKVVERVLEGDGVFETKEDLERKRLEAIEMMNSASSTMTSSSSNLGGSPTDPTSNPQNPFNMTAMSFMNRPMTPTPLSPTTTTPTPSSIDVESLLPESASLPPSPLPEQPTMLLVPWTNHLGFKQVPYMLWDLFNERQKYRIGGEAGLKLIFGPKREFIGKQGQGASGASDGGMGQERLLEDIAGDGHPNVTPTLPASSSTLPSDLDFDLDTEAYYKKAFNETTTRIQKNRDSYYSELAPRILLARELASGTREPTADEQAKPPATETELREERLKREVRWKNEEEGHEIVKKGKEVTWDSRWKGWLKVYADIPEDRYPALPLPKVEVKDEPVERVVQ